MPVSLNIRILNLFDGIIPTQKCLRFLTTKTIDFNYFLENNDSEQPLFASNIVRFKQVDIY